MSRAKKRSDRRKPASAPPEGPSRDAAHRLSPVPHPFRPNKVFLAAAVALLAVWTACLAWLAWSAEFGP
jgi:hypothetical protein